MIRMGAALLCYGEVAKVEMTGYFAVSPVIDADQTV